LASPISGIENAYEALVAMLREYGLESLAPKVLEFLQDGFTQDQVSVLIQDTPEYRERFKGNELRRQAGLPALSPAEYLGLERAYRQILASAGLPVGFYDQPQDFVDWIGKDVSPSEVNERVGLAVDAANQLDDAVKQTFREFYGLEPMDLAAFFLDQDRALPQLQRIARGVQYGAALRREGLGVSRERAEQLGGLAEGRDVDVLAAQVTQFTRAGEALSGRYGIDYGQELAEAEVFQQSEQARRRRRALVQMEEAQFSGTSGIGRSTLARDTARSY